MNLNFLFFRFFMLKNDQKLKNKIKKINKYSALFKSGVGFFSECEEKIFFFKLN